MLREFSPLRILLAYNLHRIGLWDVLESVPQITFLTARRSTIVVQREVAGGSPIGNRLIDFSRIRGRCLLGH